MALVVGAGILAAARLSDRDRAGASTAGGILFDQAEIENWDNGFVNQRSESYGGQDLQLRHTDWDGDTCAHGNMEVCVVKAKAIWWLAARLAGWEFAGAIPAHGELDYRIPLGEALAFFTALRRQGVPSRLVLFPDENHWVLKPANSVRWHEEVLGWLNRWSKKE